MKPFIRTIACSLALLPGLLASAQSKDALSAFTAKTETNKATFTYKFSAGSSMSGTGTMSIQDNCFLLKSGSIEMTCNGKVLWTVDKDGEEAIIEPVDTPETAGTFNPALLITCLDQAFDVKGKSATTVDGKKAQRYILIPKMKNSDIVEVIAVVADDASALFSLKCTIKDGTVTNITIPSFTFGPKADISEFTVKDSAFGSNYIVTDLR